MEISIFSNFLAVKFAVQIEPFLIFHHQWFARAHVWACTFLRSMKDEKEVKGEGSSASMGGFRNVWTAKQSLQSFVSWRLRLRINEIIFYPGFTGFQNLGELYFSGSELSDQGWLSDLLQILFYTNIGNWSGTSSRAGFLPIWNENSNEENV